jgi:hypothetical protein
MLPSSSKSLILCIQHRPLGIFLHSRSYYLTATKVHVSNDNTSSKQTSSLNLPSANSFANALLTCAMRFGVKDPCCGRCFPDNNSRLFITVQMPQSLPCGGCFETEYALSFHPSDDHLDCDIRTLTHLTTSRRAHVNISGLSGPVNGRLS